MKKIGLLLLSFVALSILSSCASVKKSMVTGISTIGSSDMYRPDESSAVCEPTETTEATAESETATQETEEEAIPDNQKMIAFTFDDGPDPNNTLRLLEMLAKEDVPATFFLIGQNVEMYPNIVKAIAKAGHEIGNHSYNHRDLTTLSQEEMVNEITKTDQAIENITGKRPKYFRPPYGSVNQTVADAVNRPIIQWSVDSEDWQSKNTSLIIERVTASATEGAIVLLHDIHQTTVDAVPELIKQLKESGYTFVTLDTLLDTPVKNDTYYGRDDFRPVGN
ncbi:polysaccharide deacetylase family sporulation protein PdaB [Enterococcus sp. 8G7_MSG3316]|uniref:Polysaccharide deacetylase family sporulation protein PdaB n=1 Tax=Candidatus Enterococcus testudinis TaxID=1834191 RepID=A0A242AA75_9ENTE|nr:polysaccharide deacetylase family protein [Enterococcus sp. 8G7_MSG3316]OTN77513.1 polysaccharide deacetylase family sporulation protein PdaB [Enterococcus sp. 8G7_MSG3316]